MCALLVVRFCVCVFSRSFYCRYFCLMRWIFTASFGWRCVRSLFHNNFCFRFFFITTYSWVWLSFTYVFLCFTYIIYFSSKKRGLRWARACDSKSSERKSGRKTRLVESLSLLFIMTLYFAGCPTHFSISAFRFVINKIKHEWKIVIDMPVWMFSCAEINCMSLNWQQLHFWRAF